MTEKRREVGHVERRGNRWRATVTAGRRADGSKRRESRTFDTKTEAERWAIERAVELGRRLDEGAGITLRSAWNLFESGREDSLTKKTMYGYKSQMRGWLAVLGDADISRITPRDVQDHISTLSHENALHAKRALSSVLTYAVRVGILASNPIHGHTFEIPDKQVTEVDFDADPFAAIEGARAVWDVATAVRCFQLIRDLPLEPAWLACVGAGLRVEEALAIRPMDVRRVVVSGVEVTQIAVHRAYTPMDGMKATKTQQSVRVVAMLEPFGERLWELAQATERSERVCRISPNRQNKAWRNYFAPPILKPSKHTPVSTTYRGRLQELPYLPLSRMRNTHATLIQQAGVLDSINAAMHGHSEQVSRRHYLRPDTTQATVAASNALKLVM